MRQLVWACGGHLTVPGRDYDERVPLSRRSAPDALPNVIALARAGLGDVRVVDLSDSNPTRHGLTDLAVSQVVARAAARPPAYDPDPRGPIRAREALAARFGGHPSEYWVTAGTSMAYGWLFALLADAGHAVAVPQPGYPLVEPLAHLADLNTVEYPAYYLHPHGWENDLDALGRVLAERPARAVVVVHPNNPTGACADAALLDVCARTGVPVIVDEVFWPFAVEAPTPAPRLPGATSTLTFGLDGVSKLLAVPHLKLGWIRMSGPPAAVAEAAPVLDRIADAYLPVSTPIADALPDLLALADAQIARVRARLATNVAFAREFFAAPYRVRRVDAGWTVLVDVPRVFGTNDLAVTLLERAHLSVQPGWLYDLETPGALALSLLPEPAAFADGCRGLRDAIAALT